MTHTAQQQGLREEIKDLEEEELKAWQHAEYYFWEVLTGEKSLDEAREDILSFRNSEYYTGTNPKYKELKGELS